jgi:hypothetical protein
MISRFFCIAILLILSVSCASKGPTTKVVVSVYDQHMMVLDKGMLVDVYPISTSKFGLGDREGSYKTPVGKMEVAKLIGHGAPQGAVFKSRQRTGEVLRPNAPGRDPIVTRIIWLKGTEPATKNAYGRYIYIHGTPEERTIGTPSSYGCVRMKSCDVVRLFDLLEPGTEVEVTTEPLPQFAASFRATEEKETAKTKSEESEKEEAQVTEANSPAGADSTDSV